MAFELSHRETGVLRGIVTLVLPAYPDLDEGARGAVERDVTDYVSTQIASMPSFLRLPYRLALLGFALLPLIRYGRSFKGLPEDRKASYFAWWNDARFSPMRDFVKLIRSTALLVYFDHPLVRERLDREGQLVALGEPEKAANE